MPIEVTMPALSPTMEEGTLAKWLVKEGDSVSAGDVIAEIETDKATMEVEAVDEGTVGKIVVPEGTEGVKVNAVIAVLLEEGEDASAIRADGGGAAGKAEKAGAKAPEKAGAAEKAKQAPTEAAPSTKAEAKAEAPQKGYGRGEAPEEPKRSPEKLAPRGNGRGAPEPAGAKAPATPARDGERIFASPLARRIAQEKGIDLGQVTGSGPHGRIVKADVEGFEPAKAAPGASAAAQPVAGAMPMSAFTTDQVRKMYEGRGYDEITLDGMRRTIATRLTQAKQTIPHFYLRRDVRIDTLLGLRKTLNEQLGPQGVKLSVNDLVIKACAMALMRAPAANAVWAGDRIMQFEAADVAVAVAIENGLITPVIRDAQAKGLAAISAEMKELAGRARERKLQPQEYMGGSFAISNLGMYGIESFDAVINPPHGSILAVGAGVQKPVVTDGQVGVATVMSLTLSVDHRVIDGALGAEFLGAIHANLENPVMMLV